MPADIDSSIISKPKENSRPDDLQFDKTITDFKNHLTRLWFNMDQLKFAEGFSSIYALLVWISEWKFQKNIWVFQKLNRYLWEQKSWIKQHTIAVKLKNFCDEYREANSIQTLTGNVTNRVDTTLGIISELVKKFQSRYRYDMVADMRSYKLTMDINSKETSSKEIDRNNILQKLMNHGIFSPKEIEFLRNPSNFWNFCRQILI